MIPQSLIFDYENETDIRKCFDNRHVALFFFFINLYVK